MVLVKVDQIPERERAPYKDAKHIIRMMNDFVESDTKFARVEFLKSEYSSRASAHDRLRKIIRASHLPVMVVMRNGEIYIIKKI